MTRLIDTGLDAATIYEIVRLHSPPGRMGAREIAGLLSLPAEKVRAVLDTEAGHPVLRR